MIKNLLYGFLILTAFSSCGDNEIAVPKPRGFMRTDFPEKSYINFTSDCPYSFDIPTYAQVEDIPADSFNHCYKNVRFTPFKGTLHLTYKDLKNDVGNYIDECHQLAYDHAIKATAINRKQFINDTTKVYGLIYDIQGNAASPLQFYVTDSVKHFIRGALYFEAKPNYDSIRPVLEYVREDVIRFIESTQWK